MNRPHITIARRQLGASAVLIGLEFSLSGCRFTVAVRGYPHDRHYFATLADAVAYADGFLSWTGALR